MSIQIIDGFKLGVSKPVDDRMVTSGTSSRENIAYKYDGLRVFDIAQKTAFVWIDGQWKKESEISVSSGTIPGLMGTMNRVVKFVESNKIGDSIIFDNGQRVGIGTDTPNSAFKLDVIGNVKADSFQGSGTYLSDIDASNITSGKLDVSILNPGQVNQILASGASEPQWINISSLNLNSISVSNETSAITNQYINFTSAKSGSVSLKVSDSGLLFNPSKGQILLSAGSAENPAYSFIGNITTGIYRLSEENSIGFSTSGVVKMVIKDGGKVGIGTTDPKSSMHIVGVVDNTDSTDTTNGQLFLSDSDKLSSGLILGYVYSSSYEYARIQAKGDSKQTLVIQGAGGIVKIGKKPSDETNTYYSSGDTLDVNGSAKIRGTMSIGDMTSADSLLRIGNGRKSNGKALIDFVGTSTTTDYDFRIMRDTGTNATTQLKHKGTGNLEIITEAAASIYFKTNSSSSERVKITDQGICVQNGASASPSYYFGNETSSGIFRPAENTIGMSISGKERVRFYSEGIDIYANGAALKLKAKDLGYNTYIEFFGKGDLAQNSLTVRSGYVGFENVNVGTLPATPLVGDKNLTIYNALTDKYISVGTQIKISGDTKLSGTAEITSTLKVTGVLTLEDNVYFNPKLLRMRDGAFDSQMISLTKYGVNMTKYVYRSNFTIPPNSTDTLFTTVALSSPALTIIDNNYVRDYSFGIPTPFARGNRKVNDATYDIIVSVVTGGSAGRTAVDAKLFTYDSNTSSYLMVARAQQYSSFNAIIPAGVAWVLECENSDSVNSCSITLTISKFGTQKQDGNYIW